MRNYEQDVVDLLNRLKYFGPLAACSGQGGFAWDLIRCRIRILNSPHCSSQLASWKQICWFSHLFPIPLGSSIITSVALLVQFYVQDSITQLFSICLRWGEIAHSIQISSVHQVQHSRCNRECRQSTRYGRVWWLIPACEFPIVGVLVDVKCITKILCSAMIKHRQMDTATFFQAAPWRSELWVLCKYGSRTYVSSHVARAFPQWSPLWPGRVAYVCMLCYVIERAMAEIFTSATQPLWQSGWVAEWLLQPLWQRLWQNDWVAEPLWQSGWVSEWLLQPLWQSGWVSEWLLQPLWRSVWVAAPATLAEWLSGCLSHSGRVAEWLHQPLWQSGWVAKWLRQSHQSMKWTDQVLNLSISKQSIWHWQQLDLQT